MTPLDQALKEADENSEDSSKAENFYRVFLSTVLCVPVKTTEERASGLKKVSKEERFYPMFIRHEQNRVIPCFDSADRLKNWSEDNVFDYIEVSGKELVGILEKTVLLVVNLGTPYSHFFNESELEDLRHLEENRDLAIGVRKVAALNPELEQFLERELPQHPEVSQAWVVELYSPAHTQSRLTVVLEAEGLDSEQSHALQSKISQAAREAMGTDARFFLMIADDGQISRAAREHDPVYCRNRVWN